MSDTIRGRAAECRAKSVRKKTESDAAQATGMIGNHLAYLGEAAAYRASADELDALADAMEARVESEDFDAAAYSYRSAPITMPDIVMQHFDGLKNWVRRELIGEKKP